MTGRTDGESWSGKGRTDRGRATWIVAMQLGGQIYLKRCNNSGQCDEKCGNCMMGWRGSWRGDRLVRGGRIGGGLGSQITLWTDRVEALQ